MFVGLVGFGVFFVLLFRGGLGCVFGVCGFVGGREFPSGVSCGCFKLVVSVARGVVCVCCLGVGMFIWCFDGCIVYYVFSVVLVRIASYGGVCID